MQAAACSLHAAERQGPRRGIQNEKHGDQDAHWEGYYVELPRLARKRDTQRFFDARDCCAQRNQETWSFWRLHKAAYAYDKAKKASESARAGLALLEEGKELPKKSTKKKAKEAKKEATAKAPGPKAPAKAPEQDPMQQEDKVTPAAKNFSTVEQVMKNDFK